VDSLGAVAKSSRRDEDPDDFIRPDALRLQSFNDALALAALNRRTPLAPSIDSGAHLHHRDFSCLRARVFALIGDSAAR
jgi:hypothetical protein